VRPRQKNELFTPEKWLCTVEKEVIEKFETLGSLETKTRSFINKRKLDAEQGMTAFRHILQDDSSPFGQIARELEEHLENANDRFVENHQGGNPHSKKDFVPQKLVKETWKGNAPLIHAHMVIRVIASYFVHKFKFCRGGYNRSWCGKLKMLAKIGVNLKCAKALKIQNGNSAGKKFALPFYMKDEATHFQLTGWDNGTEYCPLVDATTVSLEEFEEEWSTNSIKICRTITVKHYLEKARKSIGEALDDDKAHKPMLEKYFAFLFSKENKALSSLFSKKVVLSYDSGWLEGKPKRITGTTPTLNVVHILTGQIIHNSDHRAIMFRSGLV